MNQIQKTMEAELMRQHDHSSIHGLVVSQTEDPNVLQVTGPIDLEALARVAVKATLDQQAELVPTLACSASKLELIKAALRVFYTRMIPNVQDPIATMVSQAYASDHFSEVEGQ